MGRDKSQRVKGNVKPASSGRTAELLFPNTSAGAATFSSVSAAFAGSSPGGNGSAAVGGGKATFESLAGSGSYVPILDDSVDQRLALPLRKLGKKDPTTKIKALSELISLCSEDPTVPTQILPFYPTIYNKLSTDESKKVRELAQSLLQCIGTGVGRTLATQLKQLLPSWYLGINDTFPPAASIALNAFKAIFPTEEKQLQALKFALVEICGLVRDRIFSAAEFDKITGIEGLKKLLPLVEEDYIFDILKQDGFWALAKDESGQIRGSFYSVLTTLGETHPKLIPKSKLTKTLTLALKEEKFELSLLWNCFLTLTMAGVFNEKEIARQELIVLCQNSFYGNSVHLGQLVLPLVHKIGAVGEEIFVALEQGFESCSSNSEKLAIIRTYAEILAYHLQQQQQQQQNQDNVDPENPNPHSAPSTSATPAPAQLPSSIMPFLTTHLKHGCEFGRTISPLLKSSSATSTLYTNLIEYCAEHAEQVMTNKEFGHFVLSFLQKKKFVSFEQPATATATEEEPAPVGPATASINYEKLPEAKRSFVQVMAKSMLTSRAYCSFSILSRSLKSNTFFQDLFDPKEIPALFDFNTDTVHHEDRLEALRISLDLVETYPTLPMTLLLFSTTYELFFREGSLEPFIAELDGYDELKPIKSWLKMEHFINNQNSKAAVTKYILRKGSSTFPPAIVQGKIEEFCAVPAAEFNTGLVRELLTSRTTTTTDLTEIYLKAWDLYLTEPGCCGTEEFAQLCTLILEKDVLAKRLIYEKLLHEGVEHCTTLEQIVGLVEQFAKKLIDDEDQFKTASLDSAPAVVGLDPDFLIWHGFKYPRLLYPSSSASPPLSHFHPLSIIKRIIFESKIGLAIHIHGEQLVQLTLDMIFVQSASRIWAETISKNLWVSTQKIPTELLNELTSLQSVLIEKVVEDKQIAKQFWKELLGKGKGDGNENAVWKSKYPVKYFLEIARKMELSNFKVQPPTDTQEPEPGSPPTIDNIQSVLEHELLDPGIPGTHFIELLETLRKDHAEQFQFETLFAYMQNEPERQRLFDLLELTTELIRRNPANVDFLSAATCWISQWIRMAKHIQHNKLNYLWISKLSRAIILIDDVVKESKSEFVQEYVEFHAGNLFPNLYSWIGQLLEGDSNTTTGDSYWRVKTAEIVITALALVPKKIFINSIEPDSSVVFEKYMPLLRRSEIGFKIGAYRIMRKVVIKDDIIIPKELLHYLEDELNDDDEGEDGDEGEPRSAAAAEGRRGTSRNDAIVSYLLAWDILLTSQPNTADLANFVKADNLLPKLLTLIFLRLIPQHPKQYFENELKLTTNTIPSLSHLTCYVLHHVLSCLPYTTRWWWTGLLKQRDKVHVEKIITKYLSGKLAAEELSKVKLDEVSENITILSHPGCNQLVARYKFEETSITLTISLPLNYPLGPVSVQISDPKLHARISQLLNSRSHSLSAGLKLWKESLDDTYKDVDECTICFYVIHHATKQLPKLDCRTCKKKFHSACLYKWFSTSNKSECPLCKSLW